MLPPSFLPHRSRGGGCVAGESREEPPKEGEGSACGADGFSAAVTGIGSAAADRADGEKLRPVVVPGNELHRGRRVRLECRVNSAAPDAAHIYMCEPSTIESMRT